MNRWLRVVMPPSWAVFIALTVYLGMDAIVLAIEWNLGVPFYSLVDEWVFIGVMASFAFLYAVFRVAAFHPAFRPSYCDWLSATPWTSAKTLPLGPVHLVLQDVLLLSVAVGLCWPRAGIEALAVLQVFLGCYLALLGLAHVGTGEKLWAYLVAFGLGFMVFFALSALFYVVAGAVYVVALLGLRASLARFPWYEVPRLQYMHWFMININKTRRSETLGWPFSRLGPGLAKELQMTHGDAFLTALLAGWMVFAVNSHLNTDAMIFNAANMFFFMQLAVVVRLLVYCSGYAPPLSLRGRLAHGRPIIPGYDKVFIAPLLTVAVFLIAVSLSEWTSVPELVALPIGLTAAWWINFGMGPGLDSWRLTGNHRIVKGLLMGLGQQSR